MRVSRRQALGYVVQAVLAYAGARFLSACGDGASVPLPQSSSEGTDAGAVPSRIPQGAIGEATTGRTAPSRDSAPMQEFEPITLREGLWRTFGDRVRFETRVGVYGPQIVAIIDGRFCHEFVVNGYFGFDVTRGDIRLPDGFDPRDANVDGIVVRWRTAGGFYDNVQIITKC